jgi:hypothetical protein
VKLGSRLPADVETNGLDAQAADLNDNPEQIRVAVVWYDTLKITIDTDTGAHVPTVRVRRIEPIGNVETTPDDLRKLVDAATETRTGRVPLPFDEVEVGD